MSSRSEIREDDIIERWLVLESLSLVDEEVECGWKVAVAFNKGAFGGEYPGFTNRWFFTTEECARQFLDLTVQSRDWMAAQAPASKSAWVVLFERAEDEWSPVEGKVKQAVASVFTRTPNGWSPLARQDKEPLA